VLLPPAPGVPFIIRSSVGKPARPLNSTVELCSRDRGPVQLVPSVPNFRVPAVTIVVLLGVLVVVPLTAHAQAVYGSIFGTITDQSGAAVVGARLTVTSVQKNITFETTSNEAGNYNVTHLIPDDYNVRFQAPGFKVVDSTGIRVYVDQAARVDVKLQVGGSEEELTVSAEDIALMKTDRSDVANTFDEREIENLPLFNRNFTSLELLTPGTSQFGWQHTSAENPQGGIQIMVNGQHFSGTSYQLDGTDNRDPVLGIIVINPTLESVTQTKVTTQNYDAEFGQALAGVITVQTKSGTNDLHGSAFEFRRTGWGQARNPFTQPPDRPLPATKWNQFGGSLGGPLIKNRLFFFGDYQGTRRSNGASARLNVPTALVRSTCLDPAVPFCDFAEYPPIFDPSTGTQFTNNQIPRNRISSQAVNLLTLLPGPNVAGAGLIQNFITSGTELFNDDDFNIRIDHIASEKLNLFGRYSFADFRHHAVGAFGPVVGGPGLSPDTFAGQSLARNQSIALGANYVLKPSLLIDFRFGFFRYHVNVVPNDLGTTPAKDAGIPGVNLGDILTSGMPIVFVDGQQGSQFFFGHICGCPLLETEQQFQWVSNWAKTVGNHTFKWGADFRYAQNLRVASTNSRTGSFAFFNSGTQGPTGGGSGLATFLLGGVSSFSRFASSTDNAGERQKRWFFYGQDTFRVTRKLVLNYGLRWEIYFPQSVTGKGAGGWVDLDTGLVNVAGFGNINLQGNVKLNFTNFAPRLGIAYQATSKTVLRLGYGRSFDLGVFGSNFGHTATQNLPVLVAQQVNPSSNTASVFDLSQGPPAATFPKVPDSGQFLLPDQVSAFVLPRRMRLATLDAWNLTVQQEITPTLSLSAAYVANKGTHVFAGDSPNYDPNQPTIVGFGSLDTNQRKPFFKKFRWSQPLQYFGNDASDSYHSLQVVADKRFTRGYQFLAHYTWSKAMGYDPDY
jgi:outer membrane receptor protein involved in Fe transport